MNPTWPCLTIFSRIFWTTAFSMQKESWKIIHPFSCNIFLNKKWVWHRWVIWRIIYSMIKTFYITNKKPIWGSNVTLNIEQYISVQVTRHGTKFTRWLAYWFDLMFLVNEDNSKFYHISIIIYVLYLLSREFVYYLLITVIHLSICSVFATTWVHCYISVIDSYHCWSLLYLQISVIVVLPHF